jgi:hypothetical protein
MSFRWPRKRSIGGRSPGGVGRVAMESCLGVRLSREKHRWRGFYRSWGRLSTGGAALERPASVCLLKRGSSCQVRASLMWGSGTRGPRMHLAPNGGCPGRQKLRMSCRASYPKRLAYPESLSSCKIQFNDPQIDKLLFSEAIASVICKPRPIEPFPTTYANPMRTASVTGESPADH